MLKFPIKKIEWALFTGMEQEGPNKERTDNFTLFVVGKPPVQKILDTYNDAKCNAIYFGAGGRFEYDPLLVRTIAKKIVLTRITVESPDYDPELMSVISSYARQTYWVVPLVWNGKLNKDCMSLLEELALSTSVFVQSKILVKVDTGSSVFITQLNTNFINSYKQGYADDKLLYQKER